MDKINFCDSSNNTNNINIMDKLIKAIRQTISKIRIDIKDHITVTFLYMFMVIMPCNMVSPNAGLISVGVGLLLAVLWELTNVVIEKNKFSFLDVFIYVLVVLPYTLTMVQ